MHRPACPMFAYENPNRNRPPQIGDVRDSIPALLILDALRRDGYTLGPLVLNHPGPIIGAQPPASLHPIEIPVGCDGLCFWVTRPPLDDPEWDEPKQVRRAFTVPEQLWLDAWRPWFTSLTRSEMVLSPQMRALLPAEYEDRRHAHLYQRTGSWYKVLYDAKGRRRTPKGRRTPAFILRSPEYWPDGPDLLSVWAFDSKVAVVFAYILCTRHPEWLRDHGIKMVELIGRPIPARPTSLDFVDDWRAEIIAQERF